MDSDAYLLQACRYVDLNPVRAGLVASAGQWRWSSHRAHVGVLKAPSWLATSELHGGLMGQVPRDAVETLAAQQRYADWVEAGRDQRLWQTSLRHRLYLGDEAFVERVKAMGERQGSGSGPFPERG